MIGLELPKASAEILDSRLKEKKRVNCENIFYNVHNQRTSIFSYFLHDSDYVSCENINRLILKLGAKYKALIILRTEEYNHCRLLLII